MVRLEDLKIGDKIYGVSSDGAGVYLETEVYKELTMIDSYPKPIECVLCRGGLEVLTRPLEPYFFRTEQESIDKLKEIRFQLAKDLLKSGKFMDRLFECATSSKRLSKYDELHIYEIVVKLYKESL